MYKFGNQTLHFPVCTFETGCRRFARLEGKKLLLVHQAVYISFRVMISLDGWMHNFMHEILYTA